MHNPNNEHQSEVCQQYQSLLVHILDGLIGEDKVKNVTVSNKTGKLQIDVLVDDKLRGHIIGKGGRIARAIRSIVEIAPFDNRHPTIVNIID